MNDFLQIKGITPKRVKARHREHLAFPKAYSVQWDRDDPLRA